MLPSLVGLHVNVEDSFTHQESNDGDQDRSTLVQAIETDFNLVIPSLPV
jgi:hypothetical protein